MGERMRALVKQSRIINELIDCIGGKRIYLNAWVKEVKGDELFSYAAVDTFMISSSVNGDMTISALSGTYNSLPQHINSVKDAIEYIDSFKI